MSVHSVNSVSFYQQPTRLWYMGFVGKYERRLNL